MQHIRIKSAENGFVWILNRLRRKEVVRTRSKSSAHRTKRYARNIIAAHVVTISFPYCNNTGTAIMQRETYFLAGFIYSFEDSVFCLIRAYVIINWIRIYNERKRNEDGAGKRGNNLSSNN